MHERTVGFLGGNPDDLEEFEQSIPMHDGHESRSVIVKPKKPRTSGQPLIVLLFGGGFIAGEARQMVPYSRGFARLFDAICVCVEYRLAPENKFPAAALDAYSAVEWAAQNAKKLGASPEKGFLVGGVSAGGNLAAVVTALTVERKLQPKLTGQWLSIPALFEAEIVPEKYKKSWIAREQNAKAPGFNAEAIAGMYGAYQVSATVKLRSRT
jgi:acetyl esterase/lipase